MNLNDYVLLIPSLNPDEKLKKLVEDLKVEGFEKILIVNDGSKEQTQKWFTECEKLGCNIFTHYKNLGKGRAIKNALNFILQNYEFKGVITLDSDGQHKATDIKKIANELEDENKNLVLGFRDFKSKEVPFKSKFGNILTRSLLRVLCGINVIDSQTGLRGFSKKTLTEFLDVPGERY